MSPGIFLIEHGEEFEAVLEVVRAERGCLDPEEREARLDRLRKALPEHLQIEFNLLDDATSNDQIARASALSSWLRASVNFPGDDLSDHVTAHVPCSKESLV